MRVAIDLQSAQGDSRFRGIGRYSLSLAKAMIKFHPRHDYFIILNGMLPESIEGIRAEFDGVLPHDRIRVWDSIGPVRPADLGNEGRRRAAEITREYFIESLCPDVVHITTLFEGYADSAVSSIRSYAANTLTAVTFYDLIPLIEKDIYLTPHPRFAAYYIDRLMNLKRADIYLAISGSSGQELTNYLNTPTEKIFNIGAGVDEKFKPIDVSTAEANAVLRRFRLRGKFLMYSGATDERKNHLRLIEAYSMLPARIKRTHQLCLVGRLPSDHKERFLNYSSKLGLPDDSVIVTEEVTDFELVALYNMCDLFIFPSWHEGFGLPAAEAMACGAPVIGANTTSVPEVIGRADALFNPFESADISDKIQQVLDDPEFRDSLVNEGFVQAAKFTWKNCADKAIRGFEVSIERNRYSRLPSANKPFEYIARIIGELKANNILESDPEKLLLRADSLAKNHPSIKTKQLLIDISELVNRDSRSGIQRVVRSVISEVMKFPPPGHDVCLVYARPGDPGYRYASQFSRENFGTKQEGEEDFRIEFNAGDVFIGLDLQHHIVLQNEGYFFDLRNAGVTVYFVVYDLLPILIPNHFREGIRNDHERWLDVICRLDGLIAISRSVADDIVHWLTRFGPPRQSPLKVGWFHLGGNVSESIPTTGLPPDSERVLSQIRFRPSFLMVGTVESRKGHQQILEAFVELWSRGHDLNLVFVGQRGWHVEELLEALVDHPESGRRLFWLEGVSDEYLERVYEASSCLIAASEAEGFGLPLIEAAQKGIPIIARDISVFREVAGAGASYFSGTSPSDVSTAILEWIPRWRAGLHPRSKDVNWLTWKESTTALLDVVLGDDWYTAWMPSHKVLTFRADDAKFGSPVGSRTHGGLATTGVEGHLLHGPYVALKSGHYRVVLRGHFRNSALEGSYIDATVRSGAQVLARMDLKEGLDSTVAEFESIHIEESCVDFEVRVWVKAAADIFVNRLYIVNLAS